MHVWLAVVDDLVAGHVRFHGSSLHVGAVGGGCLGLLSEGAQQVPARSLTAPAGLGADPAVFVHPRVPLTFVAAALAGCRAGLEERRNDAHVVLRLAADNPSGGDADIGAVQAE